MSDLPQSTPALPSRLTSVRAGINAGGVAGLVGASVEGLLNVLGIDPSVFIYHLQKFGLGALTQNLPAWQELPSLLGAWLVSYLFYCGGGMCLGALLGGLLHSRLGARTLTGRYERLLALMGGTWLGLWLVWWSRQIIFAGLPFTDPRRLLVFLALLALGVYLGHRAIALRRRTPRMVRLLTPFVMLLMMATGGLLFGSFVAQNSRGKINERNQDLPNVLMVVVDALRHDLFGFRGAPGMQTPRLDQLAEEGTVFRGAHAQAPFTWTSFGSLLTGKLPRRHGLVSMKPGLRWGQNRTLARCLEERPRKDGVPLEEGDFVRAAFMTGTVSHGSGLLDGFDSYLEALVGHGEVDLHNPWSRFRSRLLPWLIAAKFSQHKASTYVADSAANWIHDHRHKRFMALVHLYSTHTDYNPDAACRQPYVDPAYGGPFEKSFNAQHRVLIEKGKYEATPEDKQQIGDLYRGGVTQADRDIGILLDQLAASGLTRNTLVVVTSDHGESLGEHGRWEHNWMYEDNLRIPLVFSWPGRIPAGKEIGQPVESIDLLPTVLDLMGLEALEHASQLPPNLNAHTVQGKELQRVQAAVDGISLKPLMGETTAWPERMSFSENGRFQSANDGRWKLILRQRRMAGDLGSGFLGVGPWETWWATAAEAEDRLDVRLFDLEIDPAEKVNLAHLLRSGEAPLQNNFRAHADRLRQALVDLEKRMPIRQDMLQGSARDGENELFEALGYGGGIDG